MRIVIDMQGAQSESRFRGIGRYSLAFARALAAIRGEHEILLALNGLFADTIEPIRAAFDDLVQQHCIHVWEAPGPLNASDPNNADRIRQANAVREVFLASLEPDMVLVTSLFEGFDANSVTSVHRTVSLPTAVVFYDLIPWIHRETYLASRTLETWYLGKLDDIKRADLLLSISASSAKEAVDWLGIAEERVINISTACDDCFHPAIIAEARRRQIEQAYGLDRPYVMYTGGIDHRKNIERLTRAYSLLPATLRQSHQLAVVCSISSSDKKRLLHLAKEAGLASDELVLTGYVSDEDLVTLYNACRAFIFPSWHEGFGLPALEAMRCGKAVIASNTSSLPEVVGRDDALFDPFDEASIAAKLTHVLEDKDFRRDLEQHGLLQAKKFGWESTARRALHAIECFHAAHAVSKASVLATHRPRLAYVSPLPPEKSGIADYSAELLQVLTRHYQVEVIVVQQEITDAYILANCKVRSLKWLRTHVGSYDRVLYHFGNSSFHEHMFDLLETVPGVVVLHDFFLSSIQAYREALGLKPNAWAHALADSHGLLSVQQRFTAADTTDVISTYPCNLSVLQHAFGIIVHSQETRRLARKWFGTSVGDDWALIPHLRTPVLKGDRTSSRKTLGLALDKFIVCAFGLLGRHKLNHRLLESWLASPLAQDESAQLVFVGENDGGDYGADLVRTIKSARIASQILITGWADDKNYRLWLAAADIGVQLRAHSRGETSGAVLDCMNNGLAVIVNSHGSMADLDPDAAWKLPDEFRNEELAHALTTLRSDPARCAELGRHAREIVRRRHAPGACAEHYAQAIERFYVRAQAGLPGIVKHLANDVSLITPLLATALARNFPPKPRRLQLLVDISVLVQCDARSGIQRVVRSILHEWLTQPPGGYQVEAVYATSGKPGYRYARRFCSRFLGITDAWALDATVEAWSGDSFVGLDLQPNLTPAHLESLHEWRRRGVKVSFVVYDLLPVLLPQAFPDGTPSIHQRWLQVITQFDGIFCISKTVALELGRWLTTFGARRDRPLQIDWFHLGANIGQSERTKGLPNNAENILSVMRSRPTFLMVGTIEPRKRHAQSLAAFELLWKKELDANLVIVGKEGWGVGSFVSKLRKHAENNVRLFWLDGVSDEYLGKIYAASDCLLANSKGEGFGLPLIEAAQHKLPIIARDIPVFHEVAADRAFYFSDSDDPSILATAIIDWSNLHAEGRHPRSDAIAWQTWHESANQLLEVVLGKH